MAQIGMGGALSTLIIRTSWGRISVSLQDGAVTACDLPRANRGGSRRPLAVGPADFRKVNPRDLAVAKTADRFVRSMLAGRTAPMPALHFPSGSPMQQSVWRELLNMKKGQVVAYGELARRAGRPGAARAAGQACGANPIPLFIPCHRVLAAHGGIGGFSSGLAWKEHLLEREAVPLRLRGVAR